MRRALVCGATGQDGSYLSKLLLEKGYAVYGLVRRQSHPNLENLRELGVLSNHNFEIVEGDMTDYSSLDRFLSLVRPEEVYALAAQSHVKVSFDEPVHTSQVNFIGTLNLLEIIRHRTKFTRMYFAATSELYGSATPPQNEITPFAPNSPYAVSKLAAYYSVRNYREGYGLHASNGILFNHECFSAETPVRIQVDGITDVCRISDLVPKTNYRDRKSVSFKISGVQIWDGTAWAQLRAVTATRRRNKDKDHRVLSIQTRGGTVHVTAKHKMLGLDMAKTSAENVKIGSRLLLGKVPEKSPGWTAVSQEMAEFLGYICACGYVMRDGFQVRFIKNDVTLRERTAVLWKKLFLGTHKTGSSPSGFAPGNTVWRVDLQGVTHGIGRWLRDMLYTDDNYKRVPRLILNASADVQRAFLVAYYACDGLKNGKGRSFTTNSSVLAAGLHWLYSNLGHRMSVYEEYRNGLCYYHINLHSNSKSGRGAHLIKPKDELRVISDVAGSDWVFDVETSSGRVAAGVGNMVVSNSEIRGEAFVTRKITRWIGDFIRNPDIPPLELGNMNAKRDWGYAKDYVEAMYLMLQQDNPDDYVIGTGETHTVREFVETAFKEAIPQTRLVWRGSGDQERGYLNEKLVVQVNLKFYRPLDVNFLLADPTKAMRCLNWRPKTSFKELVRLMVQHDLK